jgi:hypothetical protein
MRFRKQSVAMFAAWFTLSAVFWSSSALAEFVDDQDAVKRHQETGAGHADR